MTGWSRCPRSVTFGVTLTSAGAVAAILVLGVHSVTIADGFERMPDVLGLFASAAKGRLASAAQLCGS
jgi:hypothetical protein